MFKLYGRGWFPYLSPEGDAGSGSGSGDTGTGGEGGDKGAGESKEDPSVLRSRIAELEGKLKTRETEYEGFKQEVALLTNGSTDAAAIERATRRVLKDSGWSAPDIEQYVARLGKGEEQEPRGRGKQGEQEEEEEEEGILDRQLKDLSQKVERVERNTVRETQARLEATLRSERKEALTQHKGLGTLLGTLFPADEDGDSKASASRRDEVLAELHELADRKARSILAQRKAATGTWDDKWVKEASREAAEDVYQRYKKIVPDVSRIKQSVGPDEFEDIKKRQPIQHKAYTKGVPLDQQLEHNRLAAVDAVLRAASSINDTSGKV